MKNFILAYIHNVFSDFRWYRKKKGGKWYKIRDQSVAGGIEGPITGWTQCIEDLEGAQILAEEDWPKSTI